MAVAIKAPSVGDAVVDGTVSRWLKKDGDVVLADEPVVELETEKATTEVTAPAAGRLVIRVPEGQTVSVGSVVGQIDTEAGAAAAKAAPPPEKPVAAPTPKPAEPAAEPALSPAVR